jgi:DnaJ-class molecular chaperone
MRNQSESSSNFDTAGVLGNNFSDSLRCLGLAMERKVRVSFRQLSRIYHTDKHKPEQTGLTQREAIKKFQLINNACS